MEKMEKIKVGVTLDMTGTSCPGPIIGAKKMVTELAEGEVLLLISDCPATPDDLYTWATSTGNEVVGTERMASGATGFYVRRGRGVKPDANVLLDMRGSVCPGPILEARRVLDGMAGGEVMRLITDCPGARDDVESWSRATGVSLESAQALGAHEFEFLIRKA